MNKKIVIACVSYVVLLAGFSGYKISKSEGSYFTYKKDVKAAMAHIEKAKEDEKTKVDEAKNTATVPQTNAVVPATSKDANTTPMEEDYSGVSFTRVLWQGHNGEDVKKLQYILKKKGFYNGDISGQYDKSTTQALIKYQQDKKISPADGVLGTGTWNTLK